MRCVQCQPDSGGTIEITIDPTRPYRPSGNERSRPSYHAKPHGSTMSRDMSVHHVSRQNRWPAQPNCNANGESGRSGSDRMQAPFEPTEPA